MIGVEMNIMAQEQLVEDFRRLVRDDIGTAIDGYAEFAEKLDEASSGGDAWVRSLVGGPDSLARANLVDIMVNNYAVASDDVKEKIRDEVMRPLLRGNFFYIKLAVARITNPYILGDIIRDHPLVNPGANYYEEDLLEVDAIQNSDLLQSWLDKLGYNVFAATTIALQKDHEEGVASVIANNESLFQDAAHVTAATHDFFAELKILKNTDLSKFELMEKYRSNFVNEFAEMIRQKAEQANWLPLGDGVLQRHSS